MRKNYTGKNYIRRTILHKDGTTWGETIYKKLHYIKEKFYKEKTPWEETIYGKNYTEKKIEYIKKRLHRKKLYW